MSLVALVPVVHANATPADPNVSPIPSPPSLDSTFGAFLISTFMGLILLGITLHLAYRYARLFPNDSSWLKGLVALAVFLEVASSGLSMHVSYFYLITYYSQPLRLALGVWSINLYPFVAGLTMVVSQSFFARRVWILEPRYRPVVILAIILSFAELGVFTAGAVLEFVTEYPASRILVKLVPTEFCLAMAADLVLTATLIHILRRKRTGFRSTDSIIDVLVMYAVNTGLLNGVFDMLTTIFAFARPGSTIWALFGTVGAKLYAITLLAALHSRSKFRIHGPGEVQLEYSDVVFGVSVPQWAKATHPSSSNVVSSLRPARGTLNVHQTRSTNTIDGEDIVELKVISPAQP